MHPHAIYKSILRRKEEVITEFGDPEQCMCSVEQCVINLQYTMPQVGRIKKRLYSNM
jgi:hypothetical protein